ncbi:MAG: ATP-binding protein [Bacteroidota bacterium]
MVHSIKINCSKSSLKDVREFAENVLSNYNIPDVERNLIVVAIDEVCANIIIHSHQCDEKYQITIRITEIDNLLEFAIIDQGEIFNITDYNVPSLENLIKDKKTGGIGLILVKKIMDKIMIEKRDGMNICRMYKSLVF